MIRNAIFHVWDEYLYILRVMIPKLTAAADRGRVNSGVVFGLNSRRSMVARNAGMRDKTPRRENHINSVESRLNPKKPGL